MLRCQTASEVSSNGDAEAMPAFDTRMSTPPYSVTAQANACATAASLVTSPRTARTRSWP